MLLGINIFDKTKDEYLQDISDIVNNPKTLIFIDINILAYMYKLHNEARAEFFVWVQQLINQGRFFVPAWAASEYLDKVKSKKLGAYTPQSKDSDQIQKTLERLLESANLFLDDDILSSIEFTDSKPSFLREFQDAVSNLKKYTRIFKHQFDPEAVHEQIQSNLSQAVLNSNLPELCLKAFGEGDMRISHRIPPGFKDESKGENKFGDLIIWYEILAFSKDKKSDFENVVLLTNDEKIDWVYAPQKRKHMVGLERKTISNKGPVIKLVDPQLTLEFYQNVQHNNFHITTLDVLIESLSTKGRSSDFAQLAAAIQINSIELNISGSITDSTSNNQYISVVSNEDEQLQESTHSVSLETEAVDIEFGNSETFDEVLIYDENALKDSSYDDSTENDINQIIQSLRSHNWYIQNPAIAKIDKVDINQNFSKEAWFVLGRNVYQSACGNTQKAMNLMVNLERRLENFPIEIAKHILAGMVYEIYFDSNGSFRMSGKSSFLETPLQLITDSKFIEVLAFIHRQLSAYQDRLYFIPSQTEKVDVILIISEIEYEGNLVKVITSIKIDDKELLRAENPMDSWIKRSSLRISDIVQKISRELTVPKWAIRYLPESYDSQDTFKVPDGMVFDVSFE